ncbi:hypothetical protein Tco_0906060 [Tanacetum coccineum]
MERNRRGRNAKVIRPSKIEAREGHQPSTNMGGNLPPNGTLLSHHAQPFIPSSLHIPTGLMLIHVNPYSQPSANLIHGQALNLPFKTQMVNPPAGGTFAYHLKEGRYHMLLPTITYLHIMDLCIPLLLLRVATPSIHSPFGKRNSQRHTWRFTTLNKEKAKALELSLPDIKMIPCRSWVYMKSNESQVEAREVATNGALNDRRDSFKRSKKSSWDNNRGQKNKDRFSPYRGPNHGLLPSLSKSPKEILATEKDARSFEPPPKMFGSKRSRDMSKYCHFHEDYGHDTNDCRHLKTQIQEAVNSGQLSHLVKGIKKGGKKVI